MAEIVTLGLLVDCHIIGGYLQSLEFQNDVMNLISQFYSDLYALNDVRIPLHNIRYIHENEYPGSALRRFIVDTICAFLSVDMWTEAGELELIPKDVALEAGSAYVAGGLDSGKLPLWYYPPDE